MLEEKIKEAAAELSTCKYVVVLSGAGISTESGIPDFRSPVSGLWSRANPEDFTIQSFLRNPGRLYEIGADFFQEMMNADPNSGHQAIGELEQKGLVKAVVTQNIDALHQKGGSQNVIEIHGSLEKARCLNCNWEENMDNVLAEINAGTVPPRCKECNDPIKPDVILFGEAMPPAYQEALYEARKADGMLVVGSSLVVSPANMLPQYVDKLVIVNREETPLDHKASIIMRESISDVLPRLKEEWLSLVQN